MKKRLVPVLTLSLSLDLEFDSSDTRENVYDKFIHSLETLTFVDTDLKRPPMVKVVWVPDNTGLPAFKGVVQSMATKYGLFLPDGTPLRATVTLKMKSASSASVAAKKAQ
jgi:Contractile injection system tube protein